MRCKGIRPWGFNPVNFRFEYDLRGMGSLTSAKRALFKLASPVGGVWLYAKGIKGSTTPSKYAMKNGCIWMVLNVLFFPARYLL